MKKYKNVPAKRLAEALGNRPEPFRYPKAAVATRALIRDKRKRQVNYDDELALLYWLAAINSFWIPHSNILKEPGYNVIAFMPDEKLRGLSFEYEKLGYKKLDLLKKTDIKWIVEQWGEPKKHTTLHKIHQGVWREYETRLKKQRESGYHDFEESLSEENGLKNKPHNKVKKSKNRSKTKWIMIIVFTIFILSIYFGD